MNILKKVCSNYGLEKAVKIDLLLKHRPELIMELDMAEKQGKFPEMLQTLFFDEHIVWTFVKYYYFEKKEYIYLQWKKSLEQGKYIWGHWDEKEAGCGCQDKAEFCVTDIDKLKNLFRITQYNHNTEMWIEPDKVIKALCNKHVEGFDGYIRWYVVEYRKET